MKEQYKTELRAVQNSLAGIQDADIRKKAFANFDEEYCIEELKTLKVIDYNSTERALEIAFNWRETPEGWKYWDVVHTNMLGPENADVPTISQGTLESLSECQFMFQKSKYTKIEEEDGTIVLKPKKKKVKVWIEVCISPEGEVIGGFHSSKEGLDSSIKRGIEAGETIIEIIEKEYTV